MNCIRKIREKLNSKKGMTIAELLISVIIMLLVTSVMTATMDLAMKHYLDTMRHSEASVLCSTIQNKITYQLMNSKYISKEGDVLVFQSQNFYTFGYFDEEIDKKDGIKRIIVVKSNENGDKFSDTDYKYLLNKEAYTYGLSGRIKKVDYNIDTHVATVTVYVYYDNEDIPYAKTTFQVQYNG